MRMSLEEAAKDEEIHEGSTDDGVLDAARDDDGRPLALSSSEGNAQEEPKDEEGSEDKDEEFDPGGTAPSRRSVAWLTRAIPWSLFVVAATAAVFFGILWQRSVAAEHKRTEIVNTADDFLKTLTNFKAATIQSDVTRIHSFAVGDFADQVDQFFGPSTVASIKKAGVVSVGTVRSVFVQTVNGSAATILGVVNESVTNSASKTPRTEVLRVVVELVQTKSGWRVDKVDVLQTPDQTSPFGS